MNTHTNGAAAAALALAQSPDAGAGELLHVAPGAPVQDIDRGRYFTWRRGGAVRAWADPGRTCWVFRLQGYWCCTQGVFVAPA